MRLRRRNDNKEKEKSFEAEADVDAIAISFFQIYNHTDVVLILIFVALKWDAGLAQTPNSTIQKSKSKLQTLKGKFYELHMKFRPCCTVSLEKKIEATCYL